MNSFTKTAAQGEVAITRIAALPNYASPVEAVNGRFIIGHSETGHHHVMTVEDMTLYADPSPPQGMTVLYGILNSAKELTHERNHDTHQPITLQPGIYEFRSGREYDPYAELARKAAD